MEYSNTIVPCWVRCNFPAIFLTTSCRMIFFSQQDLVTVCVSKGKSGVYRVSEYKITREQRRYGKSELLGFNRASLLHITLS